MTQKITLADIQLPPICGPLSDMGRSQPCTRAGRAYAHHADAAEIRWDLDRLTRLRSAWRRENLARSCDERVQRLARYIELFNAENLPCTHPEGERRTITNFEDALPGCTCSPSSVEDRITWTEGDVTITAP